MMRALILCAAIAACTDAPATPADAAPSDVPVACDGHLCATANGGSCRVGDGAGGLLIIGALIVLSRRRR